MVRLDLNAIKKRVEAVSSGPWCAKYGYGEDAEVTTGISFSSRVIATTTQTADATFIAHAHQDVPALIAEVERLDHERKQYLERYVYLLEGIGKGQALGILHKALEHKEESND